MLNPERTDELISELIRRRIEQERAINKGIDRLVDAINASADEAGGPDRPETDQKQHSQRDA